VSTQGKIGMWQQVGSIQVTMAMRSSSRVAQNRQANALR
jgi:hypothetical protein